MDKLAFLIQKGGHRILQLSRDKPYQIVTQLTIAQISRCLQFNKNWQISLASFPGSFSNHYPSSKLIDSLQTNSMISQSPISNVPVKRPTIFTDANKNTARYQIPKSSKVLPTHFLLYSPMNCGLSIQFCKIFHNFLLTLFQILDMLFSLAYSFPMSPFH